MKTVSHIISARELYCIALGTSVYDVIQFMTSKNIGAVVIVDNLQSKRLRGIFSERDLMRRVVLEGLDVKTTRIDEVMTKNVAVGNADEAYDACLETMKKIRSRHLPIVDGEKLTGMVSMRDLMEIKIAEGTEEIKMMNAYIHDMPNSLM